MRVLRRVLPLLAAIVVSGQPRRLVIVGPYQAVSTVNPKMGVHTRLTDEVDEWKIQRTLEMVREMGSPWIVEYFPWGYYETLPGRIDWDHADMIVRHAGAQGLSIIARIDYVPDWARPRDTTHRYIDERHYDDYARFVQAFAQRYADRIRHVVVWNEPNLAFEWGYRQPDPAAYTELLCRTYALVKESTPGVQVLAAGLAPTLEPEGSSLGLNDIAFLQMMYASGAAACLDGLAMHAYGLALPANDPPEVDTLNFRRVELLRQIMVAAGDGHKPCYITEAGWNDNPRWAKAVGPYARIVNTIDAYELALRQWDWCQAVCMWAFKYPTEQRTYLDAYTFVSPSFVPKPIYTEVAHYAHGEPYDFLGVP